QFKGVQLHYLRPPKLGPLSTVMFDVECLWKARSNFDVVYMLGYGSSMFCWLPRIWGSEVWINMDGLEWARGKWGAIARIYFRLAERFAMWTANRIVADASAIKSNLQFRHRRIPPCDVIPYGCEIAGSADVKELAVNNLTPGTYYLVVCR